MKKFKYGFYTLLILGVVFVTNRIDQRHFETTQHSINSIYKDRVVAQDILFQLNSIFQAIQLNYVSDSITSLSEVDIEKQNNQIIHLLEEYRNTVLTSDESRELKYLDANYLALKQYENLGNTINRSELNQKFKPIYATLENLSEIQLSESKNLMSLGQKSLDSNNMMSITEIIILMIIGIVFLLLLFYEGQ